MSNFISKVAGDFSDHFNKVPNIESYLKQGIFDLTDPDKKGIEGAISKVKESINPRFFRFLQLVLGGASPLSFASAASDLFNIQDRRRDASFARARALSEGADPDTLIGNYKAPNGSTLSILNTETGRPYVDTGSVGSIYEQARMFTDMAIKDNKEGAHSDSMRLRTAQPGEAERIALNQIEKYNKIYSGSGVFENLDIIPKNIKELGEYSRTNPEAVKASKRSQAYTTPISPTISSAGLPGAGSFGWQQAPSAKDTGGVVQTMYDGGIVRYQSGGEIPLIQNLLSDFVIGGEYINKDRQPMAEGGDPLKKLGETPVQTEVTHIPKPVELPPLEPEVQQLSEVQQLPSGESEVDEGLALTDPAKYLEQLRKVLSPKVFEQVKNIIGPIAKTIPVVGQVTSFLSDAGPLNVGEEEALKLAREDHDVGWIKDVPSNRPDKFFNKIYEYTKSGNFTRPPSELARIIKNNISSEDYNAHKEFYDLESHSIYPGQENSLVREVLHNLFNPQEIHPNMQKQLERAADKGYTLGNLVHVAGKGEWDSDIPEVEPGRKLEYKNVFDMHPYISEDIGIHVTSPNPQLYKSFQRDKITPGSAYEGKRFKEGVTSMPLVADITYVIQIPDMGQFRYPERWIRTLSIAVDRDGFHYEGSRRSEKAFNFSQEHIKRGNFVDIERENPPIKSSNISEFPVKKLFPNMYIPESDIINPLDGTSMMSVDTWKKIMQAALDTIAKRDDMKRKGHSPYITSSTSKNIDTIWINKLRKILQDEGADAFGYANYAEGEGQMSYMVLDPNRLKFVWAKTFNPESPSLSEKKGGLIKTMYDGGVV